MCRPQVAGWTSFLWCVAVLGLGSLCSLLDGSLTVGGVPGGVCARVLHFSSLFAVLVLVAPVILWCIPSLVVRALQDQALQRDFVGDALLDELLRATNVCDHFVALEATNAKLDAPTVLLLAPLGCPATSMLPFARRIARTARIIVVQLPGAGSLDAVPFTLARADRVVAAVLARASSRPGVSGARSTSPRGRGPVVIAAYGRASHVALHIVGVHSSHFDGVALAGPVPDSTRGRASLVSAHFALRFPCVGGPAQRLLKRRIRTMPDCGKEEAKAASRGRFRLAALAEWAEEVAGSDLCGSLSEYKGPVLHVTPDPDSAFARALKAHGTRGAVRVLVKERLRASFPLREMGPLGASIAEFADGMRRAAPTRPWRGRARLSAGADSATGTPVTSDDDEDVETWLPADQLV